MCISVNGTLCLPLVETKEEDKHTGAEGLPVGIRAATQS